MALSNYTELKAALAGWLHRTDVNGAAIGAGVDNVVNDWITLAEDDLNAELRLRVMESDQTLTTTIGSRTVALPSDFLEPVSLLLSVNTQTDPYYLDFVPVDTIGRRVYNSIPQYWTIDGSNIRFECPANAAYTLTFRQVGRFALSDAAPTNWLLTNYPALYLYGALMHSPGYVGVEERTSLWPTMYGKALSRLKRQEQRAQVMTALLSDSALVQTNRATFNIYRGY